MSSSARDEAGQPPATEHRDMQRRSTSAPDRDAEDHQPGVSPPLGPCQDGDIDLEGNVASVANRDLPIYTKTRLSCQEKTSAFVESQTEVEGDQASISNHSRPTMDATQSVNDSQTYRYLTPDNEDADPYMLQKKVIDADQIPRRRPGQGRRVAKRIRKYYTKQNLLIESLLKPISQHASEKDDEIAKTKGIVTYLIYANIVANFLLAALQLYAALSSLSLSLFATAADAVFDPFANVVLNLLHRASTRVDKRKWPVGGARFENAGNVCYSFIMSSVSMILIVESARDIASHKDTDVETLHIPALIAVGVAFVTKAILGILNYAFRKYSSQLDMLWEDCRNDLFICAFGIVTSASGSKVWWLDPAGAIFISCGIIAAWCITAKEQFRELLCAAAPDEFLQLITYNALQMHYQHIDSIESVIAYHSGPSYVVEVDIVMAKDTCLWKAHDVAQDMQDRIELLPMVERAYVHVDYETTHQPEHIRKAQ
ncbi:hypothetical protein CBS101457_000516 [Exobasidium rhododendri]|nr:hypothetical protein CBS101457_000516 [Exobasidium rhododendri]